MIHYWRMSKRNPTSHDSLALYKNQLTAVDRLRMEIFYDSVAEMTGYSPYDRMVQAAVGYVDAVAATNQVRNKL